MNRNIVLIGPIGAGKSTVGRLLAKSIGYHFKDIDQEIEKNTGANISWIFDVEGEKGFRNRESKTLRKLLKDDFTVIATGGGIVTVESNRHLLSNARLVIYIQSDARLLLARTKNDKKRPLLQVRNREKAIKQLLKERAPLYEQLSHCIVNSSNNHAQSVVKKIIKHCLPEDFIVNIKVEKRDSSSKTN